MNKYLKGFLIFTSWLVLVLLTAVISGIIYEAFLGRPSGLWVTSPDLLVYLTGVMASYIFITSIFFFCYIKRITNGIILSIIFSLPVILFDFIAGDPMKFILDIVNLLIAMGIGYLIVSMKNKKKAKV